MQEPGYFTFNLTDIVTEQCDKMTGVVHFNKNSRITLEIAGIDQMRTGVRH